jgi:hypothetical protein
VKRRRAGTGPGAGRPPAATKRLVIFKVRAEKFSELSLLADSEKTAETLARRIWGVTNVYEGPLKVTVKGEF